MRLRNIPTERMCRRAFGTGVDVDLEELERPYVGEHSGDIGAAESFREDIPGNTV